LAELLSMEMHYTSGYHPSVDGQTEHMNQTVEQYLWIFCSYQQDDWDKLLPLAEFALNNALNTSTSISPFFANKRYNPAITVHPERDVANTYAKDFAVDLNDLHQFLHDQITFVRDRYKETADQVQAPDLDISVGDQVFVTTKYIISTTWLMKKFTETFIGPYKVIGKPSATSYQVRLPKSLSQVHPVFQVF
jgi:hypothetical protein